MPCHPAKTSSLTTQPLNTTCTWPPYSLLLTTKLIVYKIHPPSSLSQFSNVSVASYILIRIIILVVRVFLCQAKRPQSLQVPLKSFLFKVSCFTNLLICEQTSLISNSKYEIMTHDSWVDFTWLEITGLDIEYRYRKANMHIWPNMHIWALQIWSSGVSLKRSCKK